jgi:hypothetical protein
VLLLPLSFCVGFCNVGLFTTTTAHTAFRNSSPDNPRGTSSLYQKDFDCHVRTELPAAVELS